MSVFDSGIGGLTVLKVLLEKLPNERLVYFGDTAHLPYGSKSRDTVISFAKEIVGFLLTKHPKIIVIACNTASAYALEEVKAIVEIPVIGVIQPGVEAALDVTRNKRIGVIGTRATISTGVYVEAIQSIQPDVKVFSKACPLLVPLIEEGWTDHPVTYQVVREYLAPLLDCGIDTLLLGCTHYPVIKHIFKEIVGSDVNLVDSAERTAQVVEMILSENRLIADQLRGARCEIFVSDMHHGLRVQAEKFLGSEIPRLKVVDSEFREVKSQI
ncbi:MAG: glutamate racemase [bacterium]